MLDFLKKKEVEEEFDFNLPSVNQNGQYDCRYEVFRSLDKYYNGSTQSVLLLRNKFPDAEVSDSSMAKMYSSRNLSLNDITETVNALQTETEKADFLISLMKENKAVIAEFTINSNGKTYGHAVGVKTVKTFSNGKVVIKVVNVVKPAKRFKCKTCVVFKESKYIFKPKHKRRK